MLILIKSLYYFYGLIFVQLIGYAKNRYTLPPTHTLNIVLHVHHNGVGNSWSPTMVSGKVTREIEFKGSSRPLVEIRYILGNNDKQRQTISNFSYKAHIALLKYKAPRDTLLFLFNMSLF